ncbi:MAG: tryptophan halogenase [Caulobacter sp.]|nr:tryptophan halogenase [Caulobacter sp.]
MRTTIRDIVIVGGGTAGWMAAAALSKVMGTQRYTITLVESDQIGTVGVGEATIPPITLFNGVLGLDENEFMRETNATIKLGIEFQNWRRPGHSYMHPFGMMGAEFSGIGFTNHWLRWVKAGGDPDNLRFSAEAQAALAGKFGRTTDGNPNLPKINYAFHFDASLYAAYLRRFAVARGVTRLEGKVVDVTLGAEDGYIDSITLEDGRVIRGDLFLDCSGFRGLLIEQALGVGYEDWSRYLPVNRAVAMPCARVEDPVPLTRAIAREAGWQWRIPLQHRTGNGYVYCDAWLEPDRAAELLIERLDGEAQAPPNHLRFVTGRRKSCWEKNCLSLGLASGFLEPLESTSIHLIQVVISKLLALFPKNGFEPLLIARFNREIERDFTYIRDFIIAHYKTTDREDTPFWAYVKHMEIPDSLTDKLESFRRRGEVQAENFELFKEPNWFYVLYGQGLVPDDYHPVADVMAEDDLKLRLAQIRSAIVQRVQGLPTHQAFLEKNCSGA